MNKYNSIYKYTIGILFIFFLGVIIFLNIITPNKAFSDNENRMLEQMPEFSFDELFHGKYTTNFEKHISDQFVFRDIWIGIKTDCEEFIGNNESNGVFICKDASLIQTFKKPNDKEFNQRIDAINSFSKSSVGINKYIMLIPNSVEVLKSKLPSYAPVDDELVYINKVKESLDENIKFVDVFDSLNLKNNEYIFYKTDHHWTTKGAFYAYENLAKTMNFTPNKEKDFNIKEVTDKFYGSLYSKSGYKHIEPDTIELYIPKEDNKYKVEYVGENKTTDSLYNMDNLKKKDKYTVFLNGNHPLIKIVTNSKNSNKLLIVRDSYANSIVPFLTSQYSEIYLVDLRYYDEDLMRLMENNKIKDMLILYNVNTFFEDTSIMNIGF